VRERSVADKVVAYSRLVYYRIIRLVVVLIKEVLGDQSSMGTDTTK